jgi:hypothetical protein
MAFAAHTTSLLGTSGGGRVGESPREVAAACIRTVQRFSERIADCSRSASASNPFSGAAAAKQAVAEGKRVITEARECRARMQAASAGMGMTSAEQKLQREWRMQWERFTDAEEAFTRAADSGPSPSGGYGASSEGIALVREPRAAQEQARGAQEQQVRFASFGDIGELIDRESTLECVPTTHAPNRFPFLFLLPVYASRRAHCAALTPHPPLVAWSLVCLPSTRARACAGTSTWRPRRRR